MIELSNLFFSTNIYLATAIGLIGGLMHGFTGWGGAMVMMPLMSLLFGPIQALGITLFGAMLVSIQLFPKAAKIADWQEMKPLLIGIVLSIPIGNYFLFHLEPNLVIKIIGALIVGAAILQLSGWSYRGPRGPFPAATAGVACGTINGFAGVGGPPLVLYVLAKPDPAELQRANIIIAVTIISFGVFISLLVGGGIGIFSITHGAIVAPIQMIGAFLGIRLFRILPSDIYKKFSLIMLVILGAFISIF